MDARRKADEEKSQKEREAKEKERRDFLKKQKEKMKGEFDEKKKEREERLKNEEEQKEREKEMLKKAKEKAEKYYKEHKEDVNLEAEERERVIEFLQKPEVSSVMQEYDVPIDTAFHYYARQDVKKGIEMAMEHKTVSMREFLRFGYQHGIVPTLIPKDELKHVFLSLIREKSAGGDESTAQVIDIEAFHKGLVRIAALG